MPKAGNLVINGVKNGWQYTLSPAEGGAAAFYEGQTVKDTDLEAQTFAKAIRGQGKLYVQPEEAAVVTQSLEGIYDSARTGKPHYF
jgi:hypothetical protein